jgi:hypothetical protein
LKFQFRPLRASFSRQSAELDTLIFQPPLAKLYSQWVRLEVATETPPGQRSSWMIGNLEVGKGTNRLLGHVAISALRGVPVKRDLSG